MNQSDHSGSGGVVVSLEAYRKKVQAKLAVKKGKFRQGESDDVFARIMKRNMEASKKIREDRLRQNSFVLKSYQIKK